ncbi:MAG: hypothetical protein U5R46_09620 [Gammaproteobacteria bacterium]|nr:hypothetical protein [Gammaproteobacteria bacterium]
MLVIEKYLGVLRGHFPTQVSAIQNLVGNRAVTFVTGRHCELSLHDSSTHSPVLSTRKEIKATPEQAVNHDFQSMSGVLTSEKMQHEPIFYVTAGAHDLRVALRLVSSLSLPQKIYMRVLREREIIQLNDDERAALKSAIAAERIILLTETESLAAQFRTCYDLKVHETTLCLPCSVFPGQSANLPSVPRSKAHCFRVGLLGEWRAEKGVDMLPQLIRHLRYVLDAADDAPKVKLIIQKPPPKKSLKSIKKSVIRDYLFWHSVGFPIPDKRLSLSFRTTKMSKEEFLTTLMSVDLLLLPYRLNDYRHRGSGILLDGVAARKPIVYTRGMGMSEFLRHGNAEAASENPKDYADKVVRILSDIEIYRTAADQAAVEFKRRIERIALLLQSI